MFEHRVFTVVSDKYNFEQEVTGISNNLASEGFDVEIKPVANEVMCEAVIVGRKWVPGENDPGPTSPEPQEVRHEVHRVGLNGTGTDDHLANVLNSIKKKGGYFQIYPFPGLGALVVAEYYGGSDEPVSD